MAVEWFSTAAPKHNYVSAFLYGPTRSGKTHICGTFPNPIFIFPHNEGSEKTVAHLDRPMVHVSSMGDMREALEFLIGLDQQNRLHEWGQTVCVENLSHYAELVELELTNGGRDTMEKQWGKFNQHFTWMRDALFRLRAHRVLTALSRTKTKGDQIIGGGVQIHGQTADLVMASCDVVAYCEQPGNGLWRAHCQQWKVFPGGTRLRGMPNATYDNFNFTAHIAPYLHGPVQGQ